MPAIFLATGKGRGTQMYKKRKKKKSFCSSMADHAECPRFNQYIASPYRPGKDLSPETHGEPLPVNLENPQRDCQDSIRQLFVSQIMEQ